MRTAKSASEINSTIFARLASISQSQLSRPKIDKKRNRMMRAWAARETDCERKVTEIWLNQENFSFSEVSGCSMPKHLCAAINWKKFVFSCFISLESGKEKCCSIFRHNSSLLHLSSFFIDILIMCETILLTTRSDWVKLCLPNGSCCEKFYEIKRIFLVSLTNV